MNIQAQRYPRPAVLKRQAPAPAPRAQRRQAVDRVHLDVGGVQKGSRWVGRIGKFMSKVPKFVGHTVRFLGATLVGGVSAAIQLSAGMLGVVGMAGLGLAGALEMRDGFKEKDPLKMLSGSGEIVRGAYTGVLSVGQLLDVAQHSGVAMAASALGALQGGIYLTSGTMKVLQGRSEDTKQRRIEGALEIGMGVAGVAMLAGPLTPLAVGAYGALSLARFSVVNKDKIKDGFQKAKGVVKDYWQKMSDEFHG